MSPEERVRAIWVQVFWKAAKSRDTMCYVALAPSVNVAVSKQDDFWTELLRVTELRIAAARRTQEEIDNLRRLAGLDETAMGDAYSTNPTLRILARLVDAIRADTRGMKIEIIREIRGLEEGGST